MARPHKTPSDGLAQDKLFVISEPTSGSLMQILQAEAARARKMGLLPFVYFYADWCPPCRLLRASLDHSLMVEAFRGTLIVKLSADEWHSQAAAAGMAFEAIPVFFRLSSTGEPLDKIDGSAWGANIPQNMSGPLGRFFHRQTPGRSVTPNAPLIHQSVAERYLAKFRRRRRWKFRWPRLNLRVKLPRPDWRKLLVSPFRRLLALMRPKARLFLPLRRKLFAKLTLEEKRRALDLDEFYLQSILDARSGRATVFEMGTGMHFVRKMTDGDLRQAIEIVRQQKQAMAAAGAGNPREAIRIFERICAKAPFDSLSLMSIGVQYAQLGDGRTAVNYLEKALKYDPANPRIRRNLEAVRQDFGV